jgi:2-polyprenyl-3-methyl-5-hydroxy-6-metoxy-1,4-benzoquinol methylase
MIKLLQNNSFTFQTTELQTLYNISGKFNIYNDTYIIINDGKLYIDDIIINLYKDTKYIGGSFWLSSIAMLLIFQKYDKKYFENKKILELGCGLGLPSIYLSKYSNNITASDNNIDIILNSINYNDISNIKTIFIDWDKINICNNKYDIIIICDCIYKENYNNILNAIKNLLTDNGKIFIINPERLHWDDFVYGLLEYNDNIKLDDIKLFYNDKYYIDLHYISN